MSNLLANCGHSETNGLNGKPGDQTGGEYKVINWYNRPWNICLYYPDKSVCEEIARQAINAANNPHIGYGQSTRLGMYNHTKASKWETSGVTINCNADCSSSTACCIIAAGHKLGNLKLTGINKSMTTSTMRAALKAVGFKELGGSYLKDSALGFPGLIYLYEGHHVAICVRGGGSFPAGTVTKKEIKSSNTTNTASAQKNKNRICIGWSKANNLNVRSGPGMNYGNIAGWPRLNQGNSFEVFEKSGNWYRIKIAGQYYGWVYEKYVFCGPTSDYGSTPKWVGSCTGNGVNVRNAPTTECGSLKEWPKLNKGNLVDVCDSWNGWYYIRIAGKHYAWISAKYIKKT